MATPAAPVKEIGYAQAVNYNWWLYEDESTPELIWPQSVSVYDTMRRTDAQVTAVLRAVTLPVRRTAWRIDPAGASAKVARFVAEDLDLPIIGEPSGPKVARLKDKFSFDDHLRQALLMLTFGHMYFEQVYRVNDAGTEAHLRKLAPRMPKTIERIEVAPDGGLVSISQWWTKVNTRPQPIPVDRLVAYVNDKEGGNWLGQSLLRPAYKNWLIKDRLLRVQAQTIERNGMGIPLYTGAEGEESLAGGLGMATSWRSGEAAGSAVPFGANLRLVGVEGDLPDAQPAVDYHDSQIARAVLAHFLNLGTQTGSWALGTTFADFFTLSLQTVAQQIADTFTQHVIEDLVDYNFGEDEPAPHLVFDEIGSRQAATAQALKSLVDAGIVHPDQVLEESSRQQYGLPAADPATATVPPGQQAPTPPEPTQMGDTSPSVAASAAAEAPVSMPARRVEQPGLFEMPTTRPARRRRSAAVTAKYNPAQLRDPGGEDGGRWVKGPGAAGAALKDTLKLAGKIDLADDEKLIGSAKIDGDNGGGIRMALIDRGGKRFLRLGVGPEDYGKQDRSNGIPAWDGNEDRDGPVELAEVQQLEAENDALDIEYDTASPERQEAIESRLDEIRELLSADEAGFNSTVELSEYSMRRLADRIRGVLDEAVQQETDENEADDILEFIKTNPVPDWLTDPAAMDRVKRLASRTEMITFDQGVVPGSAWGDVQFSVELDDPTVGVQLVLGAIPEGWDHEGYGEDHDWQGRFDYQETRKFLKLLDQFSSAAVQAAAGIDTHPGGEELKHYWLAGPGAAKWSTWTELYEHLRTGKGLTDEFAKRIAAAWFHERYGYWPGDHRNLHASADVDEEADEWEEAIDALLAALAELSSEVLAAAFDPGKHPRGRGGKFASTVDKLKDAIQVHRSGGGKGDPFEGFDREQLRRAAKTRGISLGRGEDRDSIAKKLLDDLHKDEPAEPDLKREPVAETPKKAPTKRAPRKKAAPEPEPEPAPAKPAPRKRAPKAAPAPVKHAPPRAEPPKVKGSYTGPVFKYGSAEDERVAGDLAEYAKRNELGLNTEADVRDYFDREDFDNLDATTRRRAQQEGAIRANFERFRDAKAAGMSDDDLKAAMRRESEATWADKPIAVRVTPGSLKKILESGRFKSQFETGKSSALYDPKQRARKEAAWFGIPEDADPATRPIYGYVDVEGEQPPGLVGYIDQYGGAKVTLKPAVRDRTTAMWGDSLNQEHLGWPEPIDSPTWMSYTGATAGIGNRGLDQLGRDVNGTTWVLNQFVEAQIHGGVTVDDIAEVVFSKQPTAALKKSLADAGISWRVS